MLLTGSSPRAQTPPTGVPSHASAPAGFGGVWGGSRWLVLCSGGAVGEEVVVAAAGEVPLDPGAVGLVEDVAGEAAAVDDCVVALAEEGGVARCSLI